MSNGAHSIYAYFKAEELNPDLILEFINSTCPSDLYTVSKVPNLRQCVGTNRFWGPALGMAAFESLPENLQSKIYKTSLIRIAVLTRTIFVVDDYIDDEKVSVDEKLILQSWLSNLTSELSSNYANVGADFDIFLKFHERSRIAGARRDLKIASDNIFDLSVEKFILFVNPFRFELSTIFHGNTSFQKFLDYYFFACQILDDFFDMEEDFIKEVNNNIFLTQLSIENQKKLSKHKGAFARSVICCIENNFAINDFEQIVEGSMVAKTYLAALMYFLKKKKRELEKWSDEDAAIFDNLRFEKWYIADSLLDNIDWGKINLPPNELLLDIRPELMQTEYFGFEKIEEV